MQPEDQGLQSERIVKASLEYQDEEEKATQKFARYLYSKERTIVRDRER
jgi:hypothetical protein